MSGEIRHPTSIALQCVPMLNLVLDQVRDTGVEWEVDVFEAVQNGLYEHRNNLRCIVDSIRAKPFQTFFRADALRQAATTLVDGVRGTSQAAMLSSAKVRVARMQAEEECAGLELTSLQPRSGELQLGSGAPSIGSDLTGEKLADRLNRIHSRMDDVLPLVAKAREYLAVIREQLPPRTTPQQLLVVVNPGTSSTISDISREAQPEGQASNSFELPRKLIPPLHR
ncbi:hypothetical protein R3P38DRAFT_872677 [Favolaschia claudopus]|uniref:Uncharacterized protein n=1 Tax=Favolaschia claudopus TaxID=2862362 RepID=A0AAV9Z1A8_9AGAR